MKDLQPQMLKTPVASPRRERRNSARPHLNGGLLLLILFFALGLGTGYLVWGVSPEGDRQAAAGEQASITADPDSPSKVTRYAVEIDDDPVLGPEDAPITIIEFSDYECPYCQRWHREVWSQLQDAYPDQIRLVYRDFPLYNVHPNAGPAAEAAHCAGDQGKYWEYHNLLLSGENSLGNETFQQYASMVGLDLSQFSDCIESNKYESEVNADYTYAVRLGVQSTPTFFINGVALIGAQPFESFQKIIELEMAGLLIE